MQFLSRLYRLSTPFWGSKNNWFSWILLAATLSVSLIVVRISVWLNTWQKDFFDALAELDASLIYHLLLQYIGLVAVIVLLKVYGTWIKELVEIRWRESMTQQLLQTWLSNKNYYRLTLQHEPDNPDQRIADDARMMCSRVISLFLGVIATITSLVSFSVILWNLSGKLSFKWNGEIIHIAGYLFWIALLYSVLGTLVTHIFGNPLQKLNYQRQRKEANFRASLVRKRDQAEQIALMNGEKAESRLLNSAFSDIVHNWRELMDREKKLGMVVITYAQISKMVPYFAGIPALLAKTITVGGLFQVRSAFMRVSSGLSWFVYKYDDLMELSATMERLVQFLDAMEQAPSTEPETGSVLVCEKLDIHKPDGEPLLEKIKLNLPVGGTMMVMGDSGLGKSTLLRTLAGIWPFYKGHYHLQKGRSLLLSQKAYLPTGSLKECISYPSTTAFAPDRLTQALDLVGLPELSERLEQEAEWQLRLSGGEQQRLSMARALLHRPETLILDEATSHLDEPSAQRLIRMLQQQLPETSLLMVSHQRILDPLFEYKLDLNGFSAKTATMGI